MRGRVQSDDTRWSLSGTQADLEIPLVFRFIFNQLHSFTIEIRNFRI